MLCNDERAAEGYETKMQCYIHFFNNVMMFLGHHNWQVEFCKDSYCWEYRKTITINTEYDGDLRQIILHEIAHIRTAKYCNQKHNPQFWKHLEYLIWKFLKTKLDKNQIIHKSFMTEGYYGLCYKN